MLRFEQIYLLMISQITFNNTCTKSKSILMEMRKEETITIYQDLRYLLKVKSRTSSKLFQSYLGRRSRSNDQTFCRTSRQHSTVDRNDESFRKTLRTTQGDHD